MTKPEPLVRLRDYSCRFDIGAAAVLDSISFELLPGSFTVVAGPSGSGKTTLALSLIGIPQHVLHAETTGSVIVAGIDVASASVAEMAQHVGVVSQEPESQFVSLYVRDEIVFGGENRISHLVRWHGGKICRKRAPAEFANCLVHGQGKDRRPIARSRPLLDLQLGGLGQQQAKLEQFVAMPVDRRTRLVVICDPPAIEDE